MSASFEMTYTASAEQRVRPVETEAPFDLSEMFFSRTDPAGIIKAGNSVFARVSAYGWDELLEKPHKIIRHPDTPRAVFWLLWCTIKQGLPVGAYVKNRAKDGRHYWVFAVVTPVEGGYLSVRLKPTSEVFGIVRQEYSALAAAEAREKLAPEDSAVRLLERLKALGFADYSAFMATALSQEIRSREAALGRASDARIRLFDTLMDASQALITHADTIGRAYDENKFIPMNFQIQAAQLGALGPAVGAISKNYASVTQELNGAVARFAESAQAVRRAVCEGLFLICAAKAQAEMAGLFAREGSSDGIDAEAESRLLKEQQQAYTDKAALGLAAIAAQTDGFRADCAEMSRLAGDLEVTRIMGKVEYSRLDVSTDGLSELLDDLGEFQRMVAAALKELDRRSVQIKNQAARLLNDQAPPAQRAARG